MVNLEKMEILIKVANSFAFLAVLTAGWVLSELLRCLFRSASAGGVVTTEFDPSINYI